MSGLPNSTPSDAPSEPWPGCSLRGWGLVTLVFLIGFLNYPVQVVGIGFTELPGDEIDNRLNNFILEHGYRCLTGEAQTAFWDAPSFYPCSGATAWSDAHLGMLPLYAATRAIGASPELAFQWHFLLSCVLNFWAAAWAAKRLGFGPVGIAAVAYVFAYSLPVVGQTQHTQLIPRFLVPLALVFAWEFLWAPRTWRLAALAGCFVWQLYISVYTGYFLALLLALGFCVVGVRCGRGFAWRELVSVGWKVWAARVAVIVIAMLPVKYLVDQHRRGSHGRIGVEAIQRMAPVPESWLHVPKNSLHHPSRMWSVLPEYEVPPGEHQMFPGFVPIIAVVAMALLVVLPMGTRTPRQLAVVSAWTALILAALVTRFDETWGYSTLTTLPGGGGIRVPGRICLVLPLLSGFAIGYLCDSVVRLSQRQGRKAAMIASVVCLAVVIADQWLVSPGFDPHGWRKYHYPKERVLNHQEQLAELLQAHPDAKVVYAFPPHNNSIDDLLGLQVAVMRASQDAGIVCVNGWSGYPPPGWEFFKDYRSLNTWLTEDNTTPPDVLDALLVIGEPLRDADAKFEAAMREKYPPLALEKGSTQ